jgi:anaerobic magnesium-protoporphyrin IX monomethyl ester cyclase
MSKILFGQSYYLRFDPKLWAAMQPYPPLGTLYAASYLRQRGHQVSLFDAMLAASEADWAAALDRYQPRYAVIYEDNFNYLSKMCLLRMRQAAFTMITLAKVRGCTVILCGADMTDHARQYLSQGADYVLLGEGEETLGELMDRLEGRNPMPLENILGLAWSDGNGGEQRSPHRPAIGNLDALPFPAWDLVDIPRYQYIWRMRHGYYSMNLVTTRGCPYHCNWCAKPIWGQRYNVRSPENLVAELKWIKETYHPDHIWFADDIMGLKPGWWQRFADLVEAQEARVPFKCLSRVDLLLRDGDIEALRRAGCEITWVGAESGSQKILEAMEKGTRVEQIYEATRRLQAAGIRVGFFLQFGYPGETWDDVQLTLKMVRECLPDDIGISLSYPLPGTGFYERVKAQLGKKTNWQDSNDLAMLYQGPYSQEFYRLLHRRVHHEFRLRRAWLALQRDALHPARWRARHLRLAASLPYQWAGVARTQARLQELAK